MSYNSIFIFIPVRKAETFLVAFWTLSIFAFSLDKVEWKRLLDLDLLLILKRIIIYLFKDISTLSESKCGISLGIFRSYLELSYRNCGKMYETTYSNACNARWMWKSLGQYWKVNMYAKKQHLVLTFLVKSNH